MKKRGDSGNPGPEKTLAGIKFTPKYPSTLVEQIEERLTNAILEGQLRGGQHLVESELERSIGVSRTPIREAFRILEQKGLLVNIVRRGWYVREITEKDIREDFPIRAWLEGLAARLAVPNMGPKEIDAIQAALAKMEKAAEERDFKAYFEHHNKYHMVFIVASKNERLVDLVKKMRQHRLWFRYTYRWHQEHYHDAIPSHRKIVQLFIEKDADGVERLVREHIVRNADAYIDLLLSRAEEDK